LQYQIAALARLLILFLFSSNLSKDLCPSHQNQQGFSGNGDVNPPNPTYRASLKVTNKPILLVEDDQMETIQITRALEEIQITTGR
jgi:hypothetical protein